MDENSTNNWNQNPSNTAVADPPVSSNTTPNYEEPVGVSSPSGSVSAVEAPTQGLSLDSDQTVSSQPNIPSTEPTVSSNVSVADTVNAQSSSAAVPTSPLPPTNASSNRDRRPTKLIIAIGVTIAMLAIGGGFVSRLLNTSGDQTAVTPAQFDDQDVDLPGAVIDDSLIAIDGDRSLVINGDVLSQGSFRFYNEDQYGQIAAGDLTGNQVYTLPDESGVLCLNSNNCGFALSDEVIQAGDQLIINNLTGAISIQGTANQINVGAAGNVVTISTPQSIGFASAPRFRTISLTNVGRQNGNIICDISNNCGFAGGAGAFVQGGNSFGAVAVLGTNDNFGLSFETNGNSWVNIDTAGELEVVSGNISTPGILSMSAGGLLTPIFVAANAGGPVAVFNANTTLIRSVTNAETAFLVQGSADDSVLTVSTISKEVTIGASSIGIPALLEVNNTIDTPAFNCSFGCWGIYNNVAIDDSDFLGVFGGLRTNYRTEASPFTLSTGYGVYIGGAVAGAGSTITSNYGLFVQSQTAGTDDYGIAVGVADTQTLWIGSTANSTTANAGIAFGSGRDTNLYRSAANVLQTDDSLRVEDRLQVGGSAAGTIDQCIGVVLFTCDVTVDVYNASTSTTTPTYGIYNQAAITQNTTNTVTNSASYNQLSLGGTGSYALPNIGVSGVVVVGTADATFATGLSGQVISNSILGSVGEAAGVVGSVGFLGNSAAVDSAYSFYASQNSGNIQDNYGLYINDQSGVGSNSNYNIYSEGAGHNLFQGHTAIGADAAVDQAGWTYLFLGGGTATTATSQNVLTVNEEFNDLTVADISNGIVSHVSVSQAVDGGGISGSTNQVVVADTNTGLVDGVFGQNNTILLEGTGAIGGVQGVTNYIDAQLLQNNVGFVYGETTLLVGPSDGNVSDMVGSFTGVSSDAQLGFTVGTMIGHHVGVGGPTLGTLETGIGVFVEGVSGNSNENYGIAVGNVTGGAENYGIAIVATDTQTLWIGTGDDGTDAASGIGFGLSRDTNLYRGAADVLQTDDSLVVGGRGAIGSTASLGQATTLRLAEAHTDEGFVYGIENYLQATAATQALSTAVGNHNGVLVDGSNDVGTIAGSFNEVIYQGTGNVQTIIAGFSSAANYGNTDSLYGISAGAWNDGAAIVGTMQGAYIEATNQGLATSVDGINIALVNDGGVANTATAINIESIENTGGIDDAYGIYIGDQSGVGSVSSYNIYSEGDGYNLFQGHSAFGANATVQAGAVLNVNEEYSGAGDGIRVETSKTGAGGSTYSINNFVELVAGGTATNVGAISNNVNIDNGSTASSTYGGIFQTQVHGTATSVSGLYVDLGVYSTANVGTARGLWIYDSFVEGGATFTDQYGIQIGTQTGATNNYGIAVGEADTQTLWIANTTADPTTANAGIAFGSSRDTNLYRSAADTLRTDDTLIVGGTISVPHSGSNSERFGASTSATGNNTVAVGNGATANFTNSTVIGQGASATGIDSVALGQGATVDGLALALGRSTTSTATGSIAIGYSADATANQSIAIGREALADEISSIAIGREATTTATNQLVIGSSSYGITSAYLGNGVTAASPAGFVLNATGGSGTDIAGANLTLAGGRGTGTGVGGNIIFQYAAAGGSGTSLNALATACSISGTNGSLSCPGAGANSERFGANTVAANANSLAIGASASVTGDGGTAIGRNASVTGSGSSVAIGYNVTATSTTVGIGSSANSNSVVVGVGATDAAGGGTVIVGRSATSGADGIALGRSANASNRSIAIGYGATTSTQNQIVVGSSTTASSYIDEGYFGSGVTSATPTSFLLSATGGSGTDIAGANFTLSGGRGTGSANGGSILFQTTAPGASGGGLRTRATVLGLAGGTGAATFQNLSDSATGFQVLDADGGISVLSVNTIDEHVGVGTNSAAYKLDVNADAPGSYVANFFNDGNDQARNGLRVQAGADDGSGTTYYLDAYDGDGDQVGYLANVGGTFGITDVSDIRTKTNVEDTGVSALEVLGQLRIVDFNRLQDPSGPLITGFIAQEVQGVYDQAVTVGNDGMLGVRKDAFIPVLVKGVQELEDRVADLETQLSNINQISGDDIAANLDIETLTVTTAATFEGTLVVEGNATFAGDISIGGHLLGNSDTRGELSIPAGVLSATYSFTTPYAQTPNVVVTPTNTFAPNYRVGATNSGFTIFLEEAAASAVNFSFQAQQ